MSKGLTHMNLKHEEGLEARGVKQTNKQTQISSMDGDVPGASVRNSTRDKVMRQEL